MNFDVVIIGGGASGLACATALVNERKNLKIAIVDAGDRLGKKLAATGNGQGNISNADMTAEHYHGGNVALVEKIACFEAYDVSKLFHCLFVADERGRIYPTGKQASALADDLLNSINGPNVSVFTNFKAERIVKVGNCFDVLTQNGETFRANYVVLCAGGKAQKQFKTDGSSYNLATALGHELTKLYPSLVQLKTDTKYIKSLKGIRAECAVSAIYGGNIIAKSRGDVIFTEYGVSGNAIFSISSYITDKQGVTLSLEFLPDFSDWEIEASVGAKKLAGWNLNELLSGTLHNQIGRAVIKRAATDSPGEIVKTLKNFTLEVTGNLGFDYAQVTKGGIVMGEVTDELESKLVKNLFFAGEILDVDGDCGGYNLQWAFTSGICVAKAILKRNFKD